MQTHPDQGSMAVYAMALGDPGIKKITRGINHSIELTS